MTLRIEYMALTDLLGRFHPDNPKSHDLGAIIQSLQMFGYVSPGAIDECSGLFVEGHGRTQATYMMKQQQMKVPDRIEARPDDWFLPVVRGIEFDTPEKVRAYLIASNRLTELGGWNEPALAELLQELAATDMALLNSTGYDGDKLDDLLRDLEGYPDGEFDASKHWVGLPEYEHAEAQGLHITVHFENEENRTDFLSRLELELSDKSVSTWWPPKEQRDLASVRFEVAEDE